MIMLINLISFHAIHIAKKDWNLGSYTANIIHRLCQATYLRQYIQFCTVFFWKCYNVNINVRACVWLAGWPMYAGESVQVLMAHSRFR